MNQKYIVDALDHWGKIAGIVVGFGAMAAYVIDFQYLAIALGIICWSLLAIWLIRIWQQKSQIRDSLIGGDKPPERIYSQRQRLLAIGLLIAITILIWSWVIWQLWGIFRPHPIPKMGVFPKDQFGIIVAEFTIGEQEREIYSGGTDLRNKISNDLERLIAQHSLTTNIEVQRTGPIRDREQAINIGESIGADLIVWGYIPHDQADNLVPNFTILDSQSGLSTIDPVLFGFEIIGEDTVEASSLLSNHIRAVSSLIIGLAYLTDDQVKNFHISADLFSESIELIEEEISPKIGDSVDLKFNLAILYLMRGRAYAALGQDEKAMDDYGMALFYRPEFTRAYLAIGNLHYNNRNFETAELFYKNSEHLWHGKYGLGLIAYQRGEYGEAVEHLTGALEKFLSKGSLEGTKMELSLRFSLGMAYKQLGNWEDAKNLLWEVCYAEDISSSLRTGACSELASAVPSLTSSSTPSPSPEPTIKPTELPIPTVDDELPTVMIIRFAYIRFGPSTAFRAVQSGNEGEIYNILGRTNDSSWIQIALDGNQIGWINSDFVSPEIDDDIIPIAITPTMQIPPTSSPTNTKVPKPKPQPSSTLLPPMPPYPPYPAP